MKYKATGTVVIVKEIVGYFEDDGKTDLNAQAYEAIRDSDDIPLSMHHDIDEIEEIFIRPIEDAP